ncbi:MAG: hypothetical protein IPP45_18705 [Sphingomonadales bacterium]|nr:hypothetical protein [Sphingomonadales bacterium]
MTERRGVEGLSFPEQFGRNIEMQSQLSDVALIETRGRAALVFRWI